MYECNSSIIYLIFTAHEDDPLTRLMAFLSDRNVRPVELFRSFEKDKDKYVSKEQFISGLKKAQVCLFIFTQTHKYALTGVWCRQRWAVCLMYRTYTEQAVLHLYVS